MKVTEHIRQAKDTLFSIEILPPLKGHDIKSLFRAIEPLMEFKPSFIDVTYHREEFIYKSGPNGLLEKVATRKRPGTVAICAAIMNRFQVDAVPHIICGGFDKEETENALIDLHFLGIDNVLALRGDAVKAEGKFIPHPHGNAYATDLICQIQDLNKGKYLHDYVANGTPTNFSIGIAGYPEKHFDAPTLQADMDYLKKKIDLGSDYVVTQMFFDNQKYFDYVKKCKEMGIDAPIIPGLKPITTIKQITLLPSVFYIDLPEALLKELLKCKEDKEVAEVGIEWCIQQSKELRAGGAPVLHYYTMSKSESIKRIAAGVF